MIPTFFLVLSIMYVVLFIGAFMKHRTIDKDYEIDNDYEMYFFLISIAYLITYAIEALK